MTVLVALALIVLAAVVAIGARRLPNGATQLQLGVRPEILAQYVVWTVGALMGIVVLWMIMPTGPRRKKQGARKSSLIASVIMLVALLIFFMQAPKELAKVMDQLQEPEETTYTAPTVVGQTPISIPSRQAQPTGSGDLLLVVAGVVVIVLGALGIIARRRPDHMVAETSEQTVAEVVDDLIVELQDSDDPRAVVIGSYVRMERAFERVGLRRRSAETPMEYLGRALRSINVRPAAISRLTALFEEARFSTHEIDRTMSREAIGAFKSIAHDLKVRS